MVRCEIYAILIDMCRHLVRADFRLPLGTYTLGLVWSGPEGLFSSNLGTEEG